MTMIGFVMLLMVMLNDNNDDDEADEDYPGGVDDGMVMIMTKEEFQNGKTIMDLLRVNIFMGFIRTKKI